MKSKKQPGREEGRKRGEKRRERGSGERAQGERNEGEREIRTKRAAVSRGSRGKVRYSMFLREASTRCAQNRRQQQKMLFLISLSSNSTMTLPLQQGAGNYRESCRLTVRWKQRPDTI